jgi:anion transporter
MAIQERSTEVIGILGESAFRTLPSLRKPLLLLSSLVIGLLIWNIPPPPSLDTNGTHFLATLTVGVVLWMGDVFDEYIVSLILLLSWVVLGIATSKVALVGFSQSSWFFVVSALGMGAAVNKSGLLQRLSLRLLSRVPLKSYKLLTFVLFASGILITPLLPTGKARAVIALPVSEAISKSAGFADRSHGSAALSLSALIGFSHMCFMFLTGAEFCLIGWNLLPQTAKLDFGWKTWFIAALPAGMVVFLFVFTTINYLFALDPKAKAELSRKTLAPELANLGPLSKAEAIAAGVLALTLIGWLTKPLHQVDETWIALAGLLTFLTAGSLDKKTFRNNVDWGLILFFGVVNSMAAVSHHLKIDRWVMDLVSPLLSTIAFGPLGFLTGVILIVGFGRFFLRKAAAVAVFTFALAPLGAQVGIHPGVLLLSVLMASECFLLSYQDGPYQIAYSSTDGRAFSHSQARKVLAAKFMATVLAIAVSIPYWKLLGFIQY